MVTNCTQQKNFIHIFSQSMVIVFKDRPYYVQYAYHRIHLYQRRQGNG